MKRALSQTDSNSWRRAAADGAKATRLIPGVSHINPIMSNRQVRLKEVSPNGLWEIEILAPSQVTYSYYFTFRRVGEEGKYGVPFGYAGEPLEVRWDLPDNVCGVYVGSECFVLFRYGARRRRRREQHRLGKGNGFTAQQIEWFCEQDRPGRPHL